jgi:F-type H+-transporting ATPase subunit b
MANVSLSNVFDSVAAVADAALVAAPVVDIDGTLFVQGGIFVALIFILNPLLFKPWLEAQARRAEAIEGAASKAVSLRQQADSLVKDYDEKIAAARERALDLRGTVRREEETKQAAVLAEARNAAAAEGEAARARIATAVANARADLAGRVEELGKTIADKLLGKGA